MFFCLIFCGCFCYWYDDVVIGGSIDCVHNVWLESMVGVELLVVLWDAYDGCVLIFVNRCAVKNCVSHDRVGSFVSCVESLV